MTNNQLVDEALAIAEQQAYQLRHEHLGGNGSGFYQLRDKWWLVIDVAQPAEEQLRKIAEAIAARPLPEGATLSPQLASLLSEC